jgi:PKHD-type hydroxylase
MEIAPIFPLNEGINQVDYHIFPEEFTDEEIMWVNNLSKLYPPEKAQIGGSDIKDEVRNSEIHWIKHDDDSKWLYDRIAKLIMLANRDKWNFSLHSILDDIQYTKYYDTGNHYDWHLDLGHGRSNHRKVSITVQLSDPDDYEGGDFQIMAGPNPVTLSKTKGTVLLFPSYLLHRVTPVTKGTRKTLVLWVGGHPFI